MKKIKHTPWLWHIALKNPQEICMQNDSGHICIARSHSELNAELLALSPTAPHHCADPKCPGDINRRKLEMWQKLLVGLYSWADLMHNDESGTCHDKNLCAACKLIKKAETIK